MKRSSFMTLFALANRAVLSLSATGVRSAGKALKIPGTRTAADLLAYFSRQPEAVMVFLIYKYGLSTVGYIVQQIGDASLTYLYTKWKYLLSEKDKEVEMEVKPTKPIKAAVWW